MTEKDLVIQGLRRENEVLRAELEWKQKEIELARRHEMQWISVKDRLPSNETEVLAVCVRNGFQFICPAIYEDGTMLTQNSCWNWYDLESYGTFSDEDDDYFVPQGWWENRQFTPDDVYNNPIDCTVTHWMPLPDAPKGVNDGT